MNVLFGKYIKDNTPIHKLNPVVKFISLILLVIALFLIPNKPGLLYITMLLGFYLLVVLIASMARISAFSFFKSLKPVLFLLLLTFLMQMIFEKGGNVIYSNAKFFKFSPITISLIVALSLIYLFTRKFIKTKFLYLIVVIALMFVGMYFIDFKTFKETSLVITDKALYQTTFLVIRVINVIFLMSILTYATDTTSINYGINKLLSPLALIKIPISTLSMMISLTFRFIPTIYEETIKISKAQMARGVDFKESNFFKKIGQVVSFLIPLLIISFKKADDLANAMEVRGYDVGIKRTSIDKYRFGVFDGFALVFSLLLFGGMIAFFVLDKKGVIPNAL